MDMDTSETAAPIYEALTQLSTIEFNDRIVSLSSFQCKKCDEILFPPIWLVKGLGNVCGKCSSNDESETALHNSALEVILENLAIPCPNKSRGCKEYMDYFDILPHLAICCGRKYQCPYDTIGMCTWKGVSSRIADHCFESHSESSLVSNGNSFFINIDLKVPNIVRLLSMNNHKFILHVKCDLPESCLYYVIYYMGPLEDIADFSFIIEQEEKNKVNGCYLQYEFNKIIQFTTDFSLDINKENALKIDLSVLQQFVSNSVVETVLKIIDKCTVEDLDENLLAIFECPVCSNYMKPPIFQCLSGHSVCSICRPKLGQCPTCRTGFGSTRNYSLETLSQRTKFPCIYRDLGCHMIMPALEISNHEEDCTVRPYKCPFLEAKKCSWEGSYANITSHLTQHHHERIKFTDFLQLPIVLSFETTSDMRCLIHEGAIFRICHKYDRGTHNAYWSVQYVGPKGEAKKYKCEIIVGDVINEYRKLIRTDLCQDLTTYDQAFKNSVILPLNLWSIFATREGLIYTCKVIKIDT